MKDSNMRKLFINAIPGSILVGRQRDFCRTWNNQKEVSVKGLHFLQEDSPNEILAMAAEGWVLEESRDELVIFHLKMFIIKIAW